MLGPGAQLLPTFVGGVVAVAAWLGCGLILRAIDLGVRTVCAPNKTWLAKALATRRSNFCEIDQKFNVGLTLPLQTSGINSTVRIARAS